MTALQGIVAIAGRPGPVVLAAGLSIAAAVTLQQLENASAPGVVELIFFGVAVLLTLALAEVLQAARSAIAGRKRQ